MPKCKYCSARISKFDKDICPACGAKKPIDSREQQTTDITQQIDQVSEVQLKFKTRKKKTLVYLGSLLAFFGAGYFYLGFILKGFIQFGANLLLTGICTLAFFYGVELDIAISVIIALVLTYSINFSLYLYHYLFNTIKDVNGVFIK
ncbi:MAG TPA: hypothetical protein VJY64_00735 [Candidatus Onthovivens sp.]|nr:hypothetical protein [Candidatus Onthovivens sp.]